MWNIADITLCSVQEPAIHWFGFTFHVNQTAILQVECRIGIVLIAQQSAGRKERKIN